MSARRPGILVAAALAAAAVFAAACGKSEAPRVDAETERAQAHERSLKGPLGNQVKAIDDAKKMQEDLNKKASEGVDKIEKDAK